MLIPPSPTGIFYCRVFGMAVCFSPRVCFSGVVTGKKLFAFNSTDWILTSYNGFLLFVWEIFGLKNNTASSPRSTNSRPFATKWNNSKSGTRSCWFCRNTSCDKFRTIRFWWCLATHRPALWHPLHHRNRHRLTQTKSSSNSLLWAGLYLKISMMNRLVRIFHPLINFESGWR